MTGHRTRANELLVDDMHKLPFVALLVGILVASCGGQPGISVTIATQQVPTVLSSTTTRTGCTTEHGDAAFPQDLAVTSVRSSTPLSLRFEAGAGATEIRGWIYELDASKHLSGPIEEFTLPGRIGTYDARTIAFGRTYQIVVNVKWSALVSQGEETRAFRLTVERDALPGWTWSVR